MKVNVGCNALTMSELAKICGGMLCLAGGQDNRDLPFNTVCTDSRETERALFSSRLTANALTVIITSVQRLSVEESAFFASVFPTH